MKEAIHQIRKKFFTVLNGNVSYNSSNVPVYNTVPTSGSFPYIWIYSFSTKEVDRNTSKYITESITRVEVVTRFEGDTGGDLQCNSIVSDVLSLLRTRSSGYIDLSDVDMNVFVNVLDEVKYEHKHREDHNYVIGIIEITTRVEQTS